MHWGKSATKQFFSVFPEHRETSRERGTAEDEGPNNIAKGEEDHNA